MTTSKDKIEKDMARQSSGILKDKKVEIKPTLVKKFNIANDSFVEAYPHRVNYTKEE